MNRKEVVERISTLLIKLEQEEHLEAPTFAAAERLASLFAEMSNEALQSFQAEKKTD